MVGGLESKLEPEPGSDKIRKIGSNVGLDEQFLWSLASLRNSRLRIPAQTQFVDFLKGREVHLISKHDTLAILLSR